MIKELSTQLSEAREDYEHLKADMAAHDARLSAIEQHLSNPDASPISPRVTSPMDISPNESLQGSPVSNKITPSSPAATSAPFNTTFNDRLEHIDGRYNRMERALGKLTNMISSFTGGNPSYDSDELQ
jgi:hypothetical protein